jgi:hypothetical protein
MLRRILSAALLSSSLWLNGCVAYELDNGGYSNSRYSVYDEQQSAYPLIRSGRDEYSPADAGERYNAQRHDSANIGYSQYPPVQIIRYRTQRQPVYYYRQVPVSYWPAPAWQAEQERDRYRHEQRADRHARERYEQQYQRYEHDQPAHKRHRGWEVRLN